MKYATLTRLLARAVFLASTNLIQAQNNGSMASPYDQQLMTRLEWQLHQQKMFSFQTDAERLTYRRQIHEEMRIRAQDRNMNIPEMAPSWGIGHMQPGMQSGQQGGMSSDSGNGNGKGKGKNLSFSGIEI